MNKTLTLLAGLALGSIAAYAVPAKPGLRTIVQPDGTTVQAELRGDEYCSFYVDAQGTPMQMDASGYLRYVVADEAGNITLTADAAAATPAKAMRVFAARGAAERVRMGAVDPAEAAATVAANARAAEEGLPQKGIGLMGRMNFPLQGNIKSVVILVSYQDVDFTVSNPQEYYTNMLNQDGFSEYLGVGSARQFFVENSCGKFLPQFDVYGPVKLSHNRSYYGAQSGSSHDIRPSAMVTEACSALDATVDFSQYDLDGDDYIDNVYVIYAGQGQATYGGTDTVWPHSSYITTGQSHDGKILYRYACSNEWEYDRPDGIGTFVHEFSHVMGLPDLYSTQYVNTVTPGEWSTMDQGPYNGNGCRPPYYTAYERNALGWIDLTPMESGTSVELPSIVENQAYIIPCLRETEFFLFENRQKTGWDTSVPGHGMLVWHVDYDSDVFYRNNVNNDEDHQYVDIIEASGVANSSSTTAQSKYTFPGSLGNRHRSITPTTEPNLQPWVGPTISTEITNIYETNGLITFDVDGGDPGLDVPVANEATDVSAAGFTASWNEVAGADKYLLTVTGGKNSESEDVVVPFGESTDRTVVLPEGWVFTGASNDVYSTASFCGAAVPSLKFNSSGISLTSPVYKAVIERMSFFIRGAAAKESSTVIIEGRASEAENWKIVDKYVGVIDFNSKGQTLTCAFEGKALRQIRITFYTTSGKMAIDDVTLTMSDTYTETIEGYDRKEIASATSETVALTPEGTGIYTYFVEAANSKGARTKASNTITVDLSSYMSGVSDVAVGEGWNIATDGLQVVYTGTPGANVQAVNLSGAIVAEVNADATGNAVLTLPAPGFYIIAAPEGSAKTIVK